MLAFIIQRLLQSVLVMLTVALIAFALFNYIGDPISNMVGQDTTAAERVTGHASLTEAIAGAAAVSLSTVVRDLRALAAEGAR